VDLLLTVAAEEYLTQYAHFLVPVSAPAVRKLLKQRHNKPTLDKRITALERRLGIDDTWTPDSEDFQSAKATAVQRKIYR
jgi:hypothetical protein